MNLLLNALDVSGGNGLIEISTEIKDNSYLIHVRDYGPGFPLADKEKIFEPFYTTKGNGFGIGLSVVKRIIDEHGGDIQAKSYPGQGALFTVILPLKG